MHFSELTILSFQVAASIFMGWDYFMPIAWRGKVNISVERYVLGVQSNVDRDILRAWEVIRGNLKHIVTAAIILVCSYGIMQFIITYEHVLPVAINIFLAVVCLVLMVMPIIFLMNLISEIIVPIGVGGVFFRSLTTFLTRTEKGPIAGIGFVFLLISFMMRYVNYNV
ncbi:hypothetical protein [Yersinia canariae]|uniref:hypothetical protein n=1 Tax=Yersinia canariae TaxID=2607663 RepID=UPI0011A7C8A0|nr:hypothetical protein [Yersinia canariae]